MPRALVIPGPGDAPRLARLDRRIVRAAALPGGGFGAPCCCGTPNPPGPCACAVQPWPPCGGVRNFEEYVRRWIGGNFVVAHSRQVDCYYNGQQLTYNGVIQTSGWQQGGNTCEGLIECNGTGVSPSCRFRRWLNGLLVEDFVRSQTQTPPRCWAGFGLTDNITQCLDGFGGLPTFGNVAHLNGEIEASCHVFRVSLVYANPGPPVPFGWSVQGDIIASSPNSPCDDGCWACCLPHGYCRSLTAPQCAAAGGTHYVGIKCGQPGIPCSDPRGACCRPLALGGGCVYVTEAACNGLSGTYLGDGFPCASAGCVPAQGACCRPDGTCALLTPAGCAAINGLYAGDGSTCATIGRCPAAATGACCFEGACTSQTLAACTGLGGEWAGPNTVCGPNACPVGACCFADGSCALRTGLACAAAGGFYLGDFSLCGATPCLGACCVGSTCSVVTAAACAGAGGVWHGPGSVCAVTPEAGPDVPVVSCSGAAGQSALRVEPMRRPSARVYPYGPITLVAPAPQTSGRRPGRGCGSCGQSIGELQ